MTESVVLHTLTWDDMCQLRRDSTAIDTAVRACLAELRRLRPSLFKRDAALVKTGESEPSGESSLRVPTQVLPSNDATKFLQI